VEDVGICLGQAFRQALGDRSGIGRYGDALMPMDETLVSAAVDFGGRAAFVYRAEAIKGKWIGTFDAELAREFFGGFAAAALCNLHLELRYGENAHHIVEALFKAFARATRAAVQLDPRVTGVPSTKGTLTS
jgi:imidazoleglycerol-phosphate dehydratase